MPHRHPPLARAACAAALVLAAAAAAAQGVEAGGRVLGRWAGTARLDSGDEPAALRVLELGCLLDLPARGMYGYPLRAFLRWGDRVAFALPWPDGDIVFDAELAEPAYPDGPERLVGRCAGPGGLEGELELSRAGAARSGEPYEIDIGSGVLPGTLLSPEGDGNGLPAVLLLAGSGSLDRDGNNHAVPGRCDSLKALAEALAARGVASLRYDKRGAGEAYALVLDEEDLVFSDYVDDAVNALRALAADARFSRVVVAGHGEGGLVAAAALARFLAAGLDAGRPGRFRLALLCATAATPLAQFEEGLSSLPPEESALAARILGSLAGGGDCPEPSPLLADFFRPSIRPYLASYLRCDILAELRGLGSPLLALQAGRAPGDQAAEIARWLEARPDARCATLPSMGRALKRVGEGPDDELAAFTDPSLPLDPELAEALAAFALEGLAAPAPQSAPAAPEPAGP